MHIEFMIAFLSAENVLQFVQSKCLGLPEDGSKGNGLYPVILDGGCLTGRWLPGFAPSGSSPGSLSSHLKSPSLRWVQFLTPYETSLQPP